MGYGGDIDFVLKTKELFSLNVPIFVYAKNLNGQQHTIILTFKNISKIEDSYLATGTSFFATYDGARYCYLASSFEVFDGNHKEVGTVRLLFYQDLENKTNPKFKKHSTFFEKIVNYFK